jgi:hypothetical protein
VDFIEVHPQLLNKKFNKFDGDKKEQHRLWDELALVLNSKGAGQKPVEKWKSVSCYDPYLA